MGATSPYILDRRATTTPGDSASFPFDRVEENRIFEERAVAANMSVQSVKLTTWADRIVALESGAGVGSGVIRDFDTLTDAAAASISATVDVIRTGGYTTAGDGGDGVYKRLAAAPGGAWVTGTSYGVLDVVAANGRYYRVTIASAPSTVEPSHLTGSALLADGYYWTITTNPQLHPRYFSSVDGTWWELVPESSVVRIEQLGGGLTATAAVNRAAIIAAHDWVLFDPSVSSASDVSPVLELGIGAYQVEGPLIFTNRVHIRGQSSGSDAFGYGGATQLHFTNTTGSYFCFLGNNVGPTETSGTLGADQNTGSSYGSILEGFTIHGTGILPAVTDGTAAVRQRTKITCRNIGVYRAPGHGFYVHGAIGAGSSFPYEGNANDWEWDNCFVHSCGGHSFVVHGNDTNGGIATHPVSLDDVGGCGIFDGSALGCTWLQPEITGYGNLGVHYSGKQYQLINTTTGIGASTTPGTNNAIWYFLRDGGVNSSFPEWSALANYDLLTIPVYGSGASSTIVGPYVEGSNVVAHWNGHRIGGNMPMTRSSAPVWWYNGGVGSTYTFVATSTECTRNGTLAWAKVGGEGADGFVHGFDLLSWKRNADGDIAARWSFYDNDIYCNYDGQRHFWQMTTAVTTEQLGRGAIQPYYLILRDTAFTDVDGGGSRVVGMASAAPTTGAKAAGEFRWNLNATGGVGWRCVTAGTPGTWRTVYGEGIQATESYDPADVASGSRAAIETITVTGAALGDLVSASFSLDLTGMILNAWVSATDTVSYQMSNPTAGSINLGNGTIKVRVWK
jgi:hypothetical protein